MDLDDTKPSDELTNLVSDIRSLRQRDGYRMRKLRSRRAILGLPVVRDQATAIEDRIVLAEKVLFQAIDELSEDDRAFAQAMLALREGSAPTLTARLQALPGSYQTNLDRMDVVTLELAHQLYKVGHRIDEKRAVGVIGPRDRFYYVRDVRRASELFADSVVGAPAELSGLITRRTKGKAALFLDIEDGTGTIQLMALRRRGESFWEHVLTFHSRAKVRASGTIVRSDTGELSLEVSDLSAHSFPAPKARAGAHADEVLTLTGVYLARLQRHFRGQLEKEGFTEVSTRLISRRWPSGGVHPLKIVYDGFGKPFFLSTSPVPQLVRALIDSPFSRVFSMSRCFTQTYRDPYVSVESVIASGAATDIEITDVLRMCHAIAVDLYASDRTAPLTHVAKTVHAVQLDWPADPRRPAVTEPEIQLFSLPAGDHERSTRVAKLCWPFDSPDPFLHNEYVVAEGYSELIRGGASLTCFTINVERLLAILLTDCDIRRIPALSTDDV